MEAKADRIMLCAISGVCEIIGKSNRVCLTRFKVNHVDETCKNAIRVALDSLHFFDNVLKINADRQFMVIFVSVYELR